MKLIATIFLLLSLLSCLPQEDKSESREPILLQSRDTVYNDTTNFIIDKGNLIGNTRTIEVSYAAISCTCAQWFETKNVHDTINGRQNFYLEQGEEGIVNADTIFNGLNLPVQLLLNGQFYEKEGYPKNYAPAKGNPEPARVFRYNLIKIIRNG